MESAKFVGTVSPETENGRYHAMVIRRETGKQDVIVYRSADTFRRREAQINANMLAAHASRFPWGK